MSFLFHVSVGALATIYIFLLGLAFLLQDLREPPTVFGGIPFIRPLIGTFIRGRYYYVRMRDKYRLPSYTLRVPNPPIYTANSLPMIQRSDRHILTVAFSSIQVQACENATGVSNTGMAKIANYKSLSEDGYLRSFSKSTAPAASPGLGRDELSRAAVSDSAASIDRLAARGRVTVKLFDWVRHEIFADTPYATYGSHRPFRHPENERAWVEFESGILVLLMGLFPRIFARQSLNARNTLVSVLNRHFRESNPFEVAAGVVNTVFSNPVVLADCQNEVTLLVQNSAEGVYSIDLAQVHTSSPVLISAWPEVLHFYGISVAAHIVHEDTTMDDKYLLNKGGPTASQLNHSRFLKVVKEKSHRYPAAALRGAPFASTEVLALVALLLIKPEKHNAIERAFPLFKRDVEVDMISKGVQKWQISFSDSNTGVRIIAEPLE
ncbi:cytochrome P450 [Xylaria arbuscula]|nr:cytochrome P450 [Xylaria arbuscula]